MWIARKNIGKKESEINSEAGYFYISSGRINLLLVAPSQGGISSLTMTSTKIGKEAAGVVPPSPTQAISTWFLVATAACDWWSLGSVNNFLIPYQPLLDATPEVQ